MTSNPDRSTRFRILRIAGGVLLVAGMIAAVLVPMLAQGSRELNDAIAEADRLDPGWRLQELQARREEIPEPENGARCIQRAGDVLPATWPASDNVHFADEKEYTVSLESARSSVLRSLEMPSNQLFNKQQLAVIEGDLKTAGAALIWARQLASYPRGRFPDPEINTAISSPPHAAKLRSVCQLLQFDIQWHAQQNDPRAVATSCRALLNALSTVRDEPAVITQLVRFAGRGILCQAFERALAQVEMHGTELQRLQEAITEEQQSHADILCMRASRAEWDDYFCQRVAGKIQMRYDMLGDIPWHRKWPGWLNRLHAENLKWHNAQVEMARKPLHLQDWRKAPTNHVIDTTVSYLIKVAEANQRTCAQLRCTAAALAAERFRQKQERWPKSLGELTPDFLPAIAEDPYDGKPLRFIVHPDGLAIYSLGPDLLDQHGKLRNPGKVGLDGLDLGIQLWDVQARRQPAAPELTLKELFFPPGLHPKLP